LRWMSKISLILFVIVWSPFVAIFILDIIDGRTPWKSLLDTPALGNVNWGLFISNLVWNFGGFDFIGGVAAETEGKHTYVNGLLLSFPVVFFNYFAPTIFCYFAHPRFSDWKSGYFTFIAKELYPWLGYWMIGAAVISSFASCLNGLAPLSRTVADFAEPLHPHIYLFPSFLSISWKNAAEIVTPWVSIVCCGVIIGCFGLLPFNFLVQYYTIIRVVNVLLEYAALVRLKWSEPNAKRPFKIPGGIVFAILISIPTCVISVFTVIEASPDSWIYSGVSLGTILLFYLIRIGYRRLSTPKHIN